MTENPGKTQAPRPRNPWSRLRGWLIRLGLMRERRAVMRFQLKRSQLKPLERAASEPHTPHLMTGVVAALHTGLIRRRIELRPGPHLRKARRGTVIGPVKPEYRDRLGNRVSLKRQLRKWGRQPLLWDPSEKRDDRWAVRTRLLGAAR